MESLFVRPAPRRGRLCLMLGASLLLHGGVVGLAGLWTQPDPEPHSVPFDISPADGVDPWTPAPRNDNVEESTPTPDAPEVPVPTVAPTSEDELEFSPPAPSRPAVSRSQVAPRSVRPPVSTGPALARTGSTLPGAPQNGAGTGPAVTATAWVMPHPSFPQSARSSPVSGTTVRITTDATGRVSSVVIVKSTGNPVLDNHTVNYVRENWRGPANAARTTEFVYQLK